MSPGCLPPAPGRRWRGRPAPAIRRTKPRPAAHRGGEVIRRLITQCGRWPQDGSDWQRWKRSAFGRCWALPGLEIDRAVLTSLSVERDEEPQPPTVAEGRRAKGMTPATRDAGCWLHRGQGGAIPFGFIVSTVRLRALKNNFARATPQAGTPTRTNFFLTALVRRSGHRAATPVDDGAASLLGVPLCRDARQQPLAIRSARRGHPGGRPQRPPRSVTGVDKLSIQCHPHRQIYEQEVSRD